MRISAVDGIKPMAEGTRRAVIGQAAFVSFGETKEKGVDNDLQDWCERCAFSAAYKKLTEEELKKLPPRNRRSRIAKEGQSVPLTIATPAIATTNNLTVLIAQEKSMPCM